ncbi:hypothetical protein ASPCADRAFT_156025, partial [Aspergillus carbonarius ITEM 5010]
SFFHRFANFFIPVYLAPAVPYVFISLSTSILTTYLVVLGNRIFTIASPLNLPANP